MSDEQPAPETADQVYHHFMMTGSGTTEIELRFQSGDAVEIGIQARWMVSGVRLHRLYGKRYALSPTYGWLLIEQARQQNSDSEAIEKFELEMPGARIIFEYFRIERSVYHEHPDDLALMQQTGYATWNQMFDLVVMLHPFIEQHLREIVDNDYKYSRWNEELDDPEDVPVPRWVVDALLLLEKRKFIQQESQQ